MNGNGWRGRREGFDKGDEGGNGGGRRRRSSLIPKDFQTKTTLNGIVRLKVNNNSNGVKERKV